jgi:hypothetical protein
VSPGNPIDFQFVHGLIFSNSIVFQADAGPPPNQYFYRYTVSNLADGLRIDGILATPPPQCPDIPGSFRHTNVQIRLSLPRPVIRDVHYDSGAIRFRFMGDAPTTISWSSPSPSSHETGSP